jgi:hypothetical protein
MRLSWLIGALWLCGVSLLGAQENTSRRGMPPLEQEVPEARTPEASRTPATHKAVLRLLEGRHWTLRSGAFRRLGPGAEELLREIAEDSTRINYLRFRALEALSLFPSDATADFLEATARRGERSFSRRGLAAFEAGFSQSRPSRFQALARDLATSPLPDVRLQAGRVLRQVDPQSFSRMLRQEPEAWVREELSR